MKKHYVTHEQVADAANRVATFINFMFPQRPKKDISVYPVPRGGIPALYALKTVLNVTIVDTPDEADILFDDLYDSGATAKRYARHNKPFVTLFNKKVDWPDCWLVFSWEETDTTIDAKDHAVRLLEHHGKCTDSYHIEHVLNFISNIQDKENT